MPWINSKNHQIQIKSNKIKFIANTYYMSSIDLHLYNMAKACQQYGQAEGISYLIHKINNSGFTKLNLYTFLLRVGEIC